MLYCGFGHRINNGQGTAVRLYHPGKEGKNLFRGDILIDGREAEVIEARKVVGTQPEAGAVEAVQSLDPPPQGTALHAEKIVRPDAFPEQCLRPAQNSFPHPFRLLTVAGAQQHGAAVGAVKATAEGAVDDAGFVHLQIQFNKYDTLTKISFDYAVVEKESSIQVLRYSGDWKDVGTWNMMAEVMADKTKGKAVLDETCENTNVVNELNIPILCMGCKDMIIAASGDGILIADKERSGYMKPYVEKIETEAMYAEKSWGSYTVIDVQPGSMTVKISMRAGEHMTYHMHNYREEVWTVVSGKGKAVVDGMEQVLRTGDVITIAAGCKHTVEAITALDMIEVQLGDEISVADKIKFPMV